MSINVGIVRATLACAVLASSLAATACQTPAGPSSPTSLEGTYWKAIALAGNPAPAQDPIREAHLQFQAADRVSGSDGCNRLVGSYELQGDAITFGRMAATRMACANAADLERTFHRALSEATRWRISGQRLELFGTDGTPLAVFEGRAAE